MDAPDPVKVFALKLVTFNHRDQKWLLAQIPHALREKLLLVLKPARQFRQISSHDTVKRLTATGIGSDVTLHEQVETTTTPCPLHGHFEQILASPARVTDVVAKTIRTLVEESVHERR